MAAAADLVLHNFRWRIEAITPTHIRPGKNFRWIDPLRIDPDISTGTVRNFVVYWTGSDQDIEPTDIVQRTAEHTYIVEISYPADAYKVDLLQEIILRDRHDIIKQLRDTDKFTGYNNANSSTDIGLWGRTRMSDELIRASDTTWTLRMEFRCDITEGET